MTDVFGWIFFISGVIFFVCIIGVFLSSSKEKENLLKGIGVLMISLLIPLSIVFIGYMIIGQDLKIFFFIVIIFAYLIVELFLDFILKIEFRDKPSTHVPYIILEYGACFSFIFAAFEINEIMGWVVSICFWVMLATLIYYIITKKRKIK
ncbi:MAG: hypothetical protein ACXAEX_06550 [Promethearchaeota archaeon]|jgi:hypothetical protein